MQKIDQNIVKVDLNKIKNLMNLIEIMRRFFEASSGFEPLYELLQSPA